MSAAGRKWIEGVHFSKRLIITGIAAAFLLLVLIALLIINISSMEALNLEIAVFMGENKLKGDMVHFQSMIKTEYGELRLLNGELTDEHGFSVAYRYDLVDRLSRDMGIAASIFVRENNNYRRIATSIVDSNGNRLVNTFLSPTSAAYDYIQLGEEYTGKAVIFGNDYLTMYRPIFQPGTDEVIGVLFSGVEMASIHNIIAQKGSMQALQIIIIRIGLIALGTLLAVVLITIFLRSSREKAKADERMRLMFDAMPLGANIHNKSFGFFDCNENAINLFGFSGKQEYLDNFDKLSPEYQPDGSLSKDRMAGLIEKAFTDGYCRFEWTHQKLNGEPIPCEITLVRAKHDNEFVLAAYMRDLRELKQRERLLNTVNSAASVLLSVNDEKSFEASLLKSFDLVGNCLDVDRVQIWRNEVIDGQLHYVHWYEWLSDRGRNIAPVPIGLRFPYSSTPGWESLFKRGEYINSPLSGLMEEERSFLNAYGMKSIVIIPMFLEGNFWGFFSIDDCHQERTFTDEEMHILASVGLMSTSAVNRNIQSANMREADERTRVMLDTVPLCVNFWDKDLNNIDCNQEAVKLFGLSSKNEYTSRFFELSPERQPDGSLSRNKAVENLKKAFEEGYNRFEWTHQKFNGEQIPCEITLVRVEYKNDFIVLGYSRDLRELKTSFEQIEESEQSLNILSNILNALDAQIYVTVPHTGEILFVNDYMRNEFKIDTDCIGKYCYKIFMGNTDGICDFCPCYQLDKEPDSTVVWEMRNPVTNRMYHNTTRYIEWADGRIVQIQHSVDVTELIEAKELAEQSNRSKNQFLSRMSHEIRTPMNAILGITEIQLENEALSPDTKEALGQVYNSGYLLLSIINDILDLSKIEANKLELTPVNYDVASLINDTVHLNVMRYDSKPIEFKLFVDEKIPSTLYGDELRIKQILNNLLSNAFKYTDEGEISLTASGESTEQRGQMIFVFRISDTGQGMTREQLDKLFDEYTRFNLEANRRTEGTGLGMSITRHLLRLMNGEISVESEPGKGSTFTVRLPQGIVGENVLGSEVAENLKQFRVGRAGQMKKAPQIVREYMPYGRILIVDDVESNLYVARGLMAPYGLSIETAVSGFEAVEKIRNGAAFDVIFMDHMMPEMDGIKATEIIRGMGYTNPIVALTANALAGQAEMFLRNGFDGFISKPIDIRQLNSSLNKLVRDRYPLEVVEAARRQALDLNVKLNIKKSAGEVRPVSDPDLASIFVRDAEKALARLELMQEYAYRRTDDLRMFVINVHAMKSALANIGETELSAAALRLEQAGRDENIPLMTDETPAFLEALREVIAKNKPKDGGELPGEDPEYDRTYLGEKLLAIQKACGEYDEKTANTALDELKQTRLPRSVKELLDAVAGYLLHSDFEEAAKLLSDYAKDNNIRQVS